MPEFVYSPWQEGFVGIQSHLVTQMTKQRKISSRQNASRIVWYKQVSFYPLFLLLRSHIPYQSTSLGFSSSRRGGILCLPRPQVVRALPYSALMRFPGTYSPGAPVQPWTFSLGPSVIEGGKRQQSAGHLCIPILPPLVRVVWRNFHRGQTLQPPQQYSPWTRRTRHSSLPSL